MNETTQPAQTPTAPAAGSEVIASADLDAILREHSEMVFLLRDLHQLIGPGSLRDKIAESCAMAGGGYPSKLALSVRGDSSKSPNQRCGYHTEKGERFFIPGCMGGAIRGLNGCTCGSYPIAEALPKRASELVELLDHCDAALTAAGAELLDMRRDLAIACNQRAQRCRIAAKEVRS